MKKYTNSVQRPESRRVAAIDIEMLVKLDSVISIRDDMLIRSSGGKERQGDVSYLNDPNVSLTISDVSESASVQREDGQRPPATAKIALPGS